MYEADGPASPSSIEAAARDLCGALDPASVPLHEAPGLWARLASLERLFAGARCRMAKRAEESQAWRRAGERSAAQWMARRSGTSVGSAQSELATSEQLASLGDTDAAVARGELSGAQASAVSDAAVADPAAEAKLLDSARSQGLQELRSTCAAVKAAATDETVRHRRIHRQRYLRSFTDPEGGRNLHVRNTPDVMAEVEAILAPFIESRFAEARKARRYESRSAYAADALLDMARAAGGVQGGVDTNGTSSNRGSKPARSRTESKVIALVDHDALVRGNTEPGERCEIVGVGPVPVSTVRSMMSDAFLAAVVSDGVDVYNVAHLGRQVTAHIRTALEARDYRCEVPDCDVATALQIDHITGWTLNHQTKLDDLAWLCRHHHDLKTHRGYRITGPFGHRRWHGPNGADPPAATASTAPTDAAARANASMRC